MAVGGDDVHIDVDIDVDVDGQEKVDRLGNSVDGAAAKLEKLGAANDKAAKSAINYKEAIKDQTNAVEAAGRKYIETQTKEDLADFRRAKNVLGVMKSVDREQEAVARSALKAEEGVKRLGDSFRGGRSSLGRNLAGEIIEGLLTDFTGTVGSLISKAIATPMGAAITAGIATGLAVGIGAALNGAVIAAGVGVALAGGIVIAAKSAAVKDAWAAFGRDAMTDLQGATAVLIQPLVDAAHKFGDALHGLAPNLARDFALVAPFIGQLTDAAIVFTQRFEHGFANVLANSKPVIDALSAGIKGLGADLDSFLTSLSGGAEGGAAALGTTFEILGGTIRGLGSELETTSLLFIPLSGLFQGAASGAITLGDAIASVLTPGFLSLAQAEEKAMEHLGLIDQFFLAGGTGALGGVAAQLMNSKDAADTAGKSYEQLREDAAKAAAEQQAMSTGSKAAADSMRDGKKAAEELKNQYDNLLQGNIAQQQANLQWKQDMIQLGETLKANKGVINDTSKAGIEDSLALSNAFKKAADERKRIFEETGDKDKANAAFIRMTEDILKVGAAANLTSEDVLKFNGHVQDIHSPNPVDIEVRNKGLALDDLVELKRAMYLPNTFNTLTIKNTGLDEDDLRTLKNSMYLPSTSATITIRTRHIEEWIRIIDNGGLVGNNRAMAKGGIVKAAKGMIARAPTVLFGERETGEELFLPRLGIDRNRAMSLLSQGARWYGMGLFDNRGARGVAPVGSGSFSSGGKESYVNIRLYDDEDRLIRKIRYAVQNRGGDVQVVLAGR